MKCYSPNRDSRVMLYSLKYTARVLLYNHICMITWANGLVVREETQNREIVSSKFAKRNNLIIICC